MSPEPRWPTGRLQRALGTAALAACLAAFGCVAAALVARFGPAGSSVALGAPVLVGSAASLPVGLLADRWGARKATLAVLALAAVCAGAGALSGSAEALLAWAALAGLSLGGFAAGAAFVASWARPEERGVALAEYAAGGVALSLGPLAATALDGTALLLVAAGLFAAALAAWALLARDAPSRPLGFEPARASPLRDRRCWTLSVYAFLCFGSLLAMALCLPALLSQQASLHARDAALRTTGFVALAAAAAPLGGSLSARFGGRSVLLVAFPFAASMAALLCAPGLFAFTAGALGMAASLGAGSGALLEQLGRGFPGATGAAAGLAGAAAGLGALFPPVLLGAVHHATGDFRGGFALLGLAALGCMALVLASRRETARRRSPAS